MNWKELEPKIEQLHKELLATMSQMVKESKGKNIPPLDSQFTIAHQLLSKPSYDIVVCGEVKKGKSTFINALVGQEILPTGVKETTSQVFRITNSPSESFSLVFTDGSTEPLSRDQLSHYGSQIDADLRGEQLFGSRTLDYIQINTPVEFLPSGVSIVDTPGLGALYQAHEQITHRYMKNAAAVVFVLDVSNPLVQQEKDFLTKVFAVTPFVMFVMTKVDTVDRANWVNTIIRTEEILKETFPKSCYNIPKIFPVKSNILLKASTAADTEEKEEKVERSLFPEAQTELLRLMQITVGKSRTNFAFKQAKTHTDKVVQFIGEQQVIVANLNKEENNKIIARRTEIKNAFESLWGTGSTKRKEVTEHINTILQGARSRAGQITSNTSPIYQKYCAQIDQLTSSEEAQTFADTMPKIICQEIQEQWQVIAKNGQNDVASALAAINTQMSAVGITNIGTSSKGVDLVELSGQEKFQSYKSSYMDAAITTGIGMGLLSMVGVAVSLPLVLVGAVLYGFFAGGGNARQRELEKNKNTLKSGLVNLLNEIRSQMMDVPMSGSHLSLVQNYINTLSSNAEKAILAMFNQHKEQFEKEERLLIEQNKMETEKRQQELQILKSQGLAWQPIAAQLNKQGVLLSEINEALN